MMTEQDLKPAAAGQVEQPVGRPVPKRYGLGALDELITAAVQLAGDDAVSHGARMWQSEGGRACPLGWGGCSQPVYVDAKTGQYDYGQPGGPGHADCTRHCRHGMNAPTADEYDGADEYERVGA